MDAVDIQKTLHLSDTIVQKDFSISRQLVRSSIGLSEGFIILSNREKERLPFHLNIIDELWASENAHSRIFNKLIQYQDELRYPLWELFLKRIGFDNIEVKSPVFLSEKHRIDVLIKDLPGKYAVIIENKIHGAIDQPEQIERYIQRLTRDIYHFKEIYVLYLTKEGGAPSEISLSENIKEHLGQRYKEISYKYDILPWIEETALPSCRYRDTILISALQQYVDHLHGIFHTRKTDEAMDKELIKFIEKELDLSDDWHDNTEKITEVVSNLDKTKDYLSTLWKIHWFKGIEKMMRSDFQASPFVEIFTDYEQAKNYSKVGIRIDHKGLDFSLLIEATKNPYYGAGIHKTSKSKDDRVDFFLKEVLPKDIKVNNWWYGYKDSSFDDVYKEFKAFAISVLEKVETDFLQY